MIGIRLVLFLCIIICANRQLSIHCICQRSALACSLIISHFRPSVVHFPSLIRPFLVAEFAEATSGKCGGDDCSLLGRPRAGDPLAAVRADEANGRRLSPQWRGPTTAEAADGICRTKRQLGKLTTQLTKVQLLTKLPENSEEPSLLRTLILTAIVLFAGRHFPSFDAADDAKTAR